MSTIRIRLMVVLFAVLALLLPSAPATAAPVADTPHPGAAISVYGRNYGAIALAMTGGAVGWSYDYGTKRQAFRWAMQECRDASDYPWTCEKVAWVRNGCLGLAVLWDGDYIDRYGWGAAMTKRKAYRRALQECGYGCVRRAWTCTTR